jgi:hypothetical protein
MRWFHRHYGASPLHLIGHLAAFVVAAWAIGQILGGGAIVNWIAWFVGAALLHDFVALPVYSSLDRVLSAAGRREPRRFRAPVGNHLRAPAVISGILLIVYFPLILGLSSSNYHNDTGHRLAGYTRNWLLITAGLFLVSALIYVIRAAPRPERRPPPTPPPSEQPGD